MQPVPNSTVRSAMPLLLALLLGACASQPPLTRQAPPALIPPLPDIARQPKPPSECLPTCSDGLLKELQSWPITLTEPARPAKPAKPLTTL